MLHVYTFWSDALSGNTNDTVTIKPESSWLLLYVGHSSSQLTVVTQR